jgi:C1A family cysteine protease
MLEVRRIPRLGWKPPLPDPRRPKYKTYRPTFLAPALPNYMDLRRYCPKVYDQGNLGSCTANALAGLYEFLAKRSKKPVYVPSRLFIYYNERVIEGSVREDAGASLADGVYVLNKLGAPHESIWWYDIAKFAVKPSKRVYDDGLNHTTGSGLSLDNTNVDELRSTLVRGYPFVLGFSVYESFMDDTVARTGVVKLPGNHEMLLGGHAVLAVGYDHTKRIFICRNSWGPDWGKAGYFTMPYDYVVNPDLSDDFWTIDIING